MNLAVDLDGTLWTHPTPPNYMDPAGLDHVAPRAGLVKHVQEHQDNVYFVTGRAPQLLPHLRRAVTRITGIQRPRILTRQDKDFDWQKYANCKIEQLQSISSCGVYIGDLPVDARIAASAGWAFIHAAEGPWTS